VRRERAHNDCLPPQRTWAFPAHLEFTSTAMSQSACGYFRIQGKITFRGVKQPETLDATFLNRPPDRRTNTEIVDFTIKGQFERSAFGMNADENYISNNVDLFIHKSFSAKAAALAS
jgi:polyisoprenoid-binding protein YceI